MRIALANEREAKGLLEEISIIEEFEIIESKNVETFFGNLSIEAKNDYLIKGKYYFVIYTKLCPCQSAGHEDVAGISFSDCEEEVIKICAIYDKNFNFVRKGTLENMAKALNIIPDVDYVDVSNIESKPELFLKIYKAFVGDFAPSPQQMADTALGTAKMGNLSTAFLIKPKNPIDMICEKEGISRSGLSKSTGISVASINNALSRGVCSRFMVAKLRKVYKYA